jgi:HK97 family phage portal protein
MSLFTTFGRWVQSGLRRLVGVQVAGPAAPATGDEPATPVTFDSAMQLSAVWACVKLLAETVASLPVTVYRITANGRVVAERHWLQVLFGSKVNRYQTRIEFFETVLVQLVTSGNAYIQIQRGAGGDIVGLLPLMSAQMRVTLHSDRSLTYDYTDGGGVTVFSSRSIWHIKLMGNGVIGMSPLEYQRNTLGIAQGAEKATSKIYKNGGKPSGVLKLDKLLTPDQRAEARLRFDSLTTGTDDRLLVLEKGADFDAISLSPQDIELLASRKFQIAEICRWYGVPSVMVNDNAGTSTWGSGIEQIVAGFYKVTLRPLIEKIEASIDVHLLGEDRFTYECEFDFDALLRADMKARFEAYRVGIAGGFMKPNEARACERMDAAPGGDQLLVQGAMVPITMAGKQQQTTPANGGSDGIQDDQAG